MSILAWAVFGLVVGVVTHLIDPADSWGGILGTAALGIVGALVGGFLGNLVLGIGISGFNFSSFVVAILGSLLVLFVQRSFRRV